MDHDYTPYLMAAITWARQAGSRQLDFFRSRHLEMYTKSNANDIVTAADRESEHIILDSIRRD
ncbi:MAG: inositol monophosphatase, partial [Muribaculaceae bacterium]|nr:inositol monophosphatase [Muribaculaceae bacterium]